MKATAKWLLANTSITKNDILSIEKSSVEDEQSGYGVFVDLTDFTTTENESETLELLRIPRTETFSIKTVTQVLESHDDKSDFVVKLKETLRDFMGNRKHVKFINETNLLIVFLITAAISSHEIYIPKTLEYYLNEVLLKTPVSIPVNPFQEDALNWSRYYKEYLNYPQEQFLKILNDFFTVIFPGYDHSRTVSLIYASVVSRILEIPEAVGNNSEDFYVTPTLVPMLDFVNHDNDRKNAYFDIDRDTQDVLLLLELSKIDKKKQAEVFISYSAVEELVHFEQIYGFLPSSNQGQLYCLRMDQEFLSSVPFSNIILSHFYLSMAIRPTIQLVLYPNEVLINDCIEEFGACILPFVKDPEDSNRPCFSYEEAAGQYLCRYLDKSSNSVVCAAMDQNQCIEEFFTDDESSMLYETAVDDFKIYFKKFIDFRLGKIAKLKVNSSHSSFAQFLHKETQLLTILKTQYESDEKVMWYEKLGGSGKVVPAAPFPPPSELDCLTIPTAPE